MIWDVILVILAIIGVVLYIKNKKVIRILPYVLTIYITPLYNILDREFFVEIFGCGCVPSAQTNIFNISFNANDLKFVAYSIITILMLVLGIVISKNFKSMRNKVIYNISVISVNIVLTLLICQKFMWN